MMLLDGLAQAMVGDGGQPNLFFATDSRGGVLAVFTEGSHALAFARNTASVYMIEDRKDGTVWESAESIKAQTGADT